MSLSTEPALAPSAASVFAGYRAAAEVFDEMKTASGEVRAHWQPFVASIEELGRDGLRERRESARQLLREHGVTYNVNAEGQSAERTWGLDPLPLLISPQEWAHLEGGLIQRTRLLNLVLADIYGPQRLLREGLLPPALLHANSGFLRACHGLRPPRDLFLTQHAVDLTRAPNGGWWVISDRTQAPSGVGYSLENRIIVSRVMAEEFRESNVQRLAGFFAARRAGLRAMAPWTHAPTVVLLTPGPLAETYFEHAYLARYLGFPLVEGSDLTVRDQRVCIKTLEGLQPVDVIVRHVDDTFCDPLEFRADSFLGVPGLVEAARAGNVAISNALGSGAVEAPALLAFLPRLARALLGEKLRIPNVATWWCGQKRERGYALEHLAKLVVKRSFLGHADPSFGETLDAAERDRLAARICADPYDFVGQERVALSTAPVWDGAGIEQRPLILRCFVCATPDGFAAMPGGLTRLSAAPHSPVVSSKHGGGSKDAWVLSERPVEIVTLLEPSTQPVRLERTTAHVPSRAAESLFWLGRYAERFEDTTRLLRTALSRLAGEGGPAEDAELAAVMRWFVHLGKLPPRFATRTAWRELSTALRDLIFDPARVGGVRAQLRRIGSLTASVRDRLSGDTWRILNQMQTEFPEPLPRFSPGAALAILHRVIFQLAAFSGMEMENMTRGHAWRFLTIGRRLERAMNVVASIRAALAGLEEDDSVLVPLLEYTDSTMTYRRRYFARPELPTTLDLLLADDSNPRALAFQFAALGEQLAGLPATNGPELDEFASVAAVLGAADVVALGAGALEGEREPLESWLVQVARGCAEVSDSLTATYFSHVQARVS